MDEDLSEKEAAGDTNESEEKTREDEDEDDVSTGKRSKHSKKHRHKHSKKHKHKHKKRKHKKRLTSRSRSRSSSRSRSKSPDSNGEEFEDQPQSESNKITEEEMKVAFSKENGTVNQEMRNKAKATGGESEDSISEDIVLDDCGNSTSFKLTKSPARSVSPKELGLKRPMVKALEVPNVENKVNLGFPFKIGLSSKSKSKSPDRQSRSRSGSPSDSKNKEKSESTSDPKMKKRSRSSFDSKMEKRSRSPSDHKIKKQSRSHSRSRSQSRKSKSKSPRKCDSKKKSRSKSRSRSHSKHRSRSHSKSRSRSPQKHKRKSRSRSRSSSYSRKKSRKERSRSRSVSVESRSRSPRKKERTSYSSKTRGRNRSPSYKDRRSRYTASPRRNRRSTSYERKQHYDSRSRRMRSRSPKRRYSRRSRSRSDTRERSRRHRSYSRSPRRGKSRTPSRDRYRCRSRSGSKSRSHRRRSRSRSFSPRRKKSRSRSRSQDRHQRRSRSKSKDKNDNKENNNTAKEKVVTSTTITTVNVVKPSVQDLVGKAPTISDPSNKRSLAELTEFCKKLTEARGIETEGNEKENKMEEDKDAEVEISHPFLVAPKKDITIPQVIFPVRALPPPLVSSDKPLTEQFPVSCGTKHHEKEEEETGKDLIIPHIDGSAVQTQQVFQAPQNHEKLDISGLVVKRIDAQRRLQADPNDVDAMLSLQEVEMKLNNWCQSNVKPGQFTGQLAKTMMPKEKFNSGYQAWAKKDMFHNLNPVSGGIGMKLLQKMGWQPGQVLGKRGEGMAEPIALTVKVDRKGLSSNAEKPVGKKAGNKPIIDLQGKHPISSLQEYCARRKWQVPEFTLIFDEGPPHSKQFLFKVAVNGYEYQHPVVSSNKKHAKAQAAVAALKGLGLVPEDAEY